ncbi:hypothetical protein LTR56_028277, partial [Elasticomyces elasticus]
MATLTSTTSIELAKEIELLSINMLRIFSTNQLDTPAAKSLISPDLHAEFDHFPAARDAADRVAILTSVSRHNPDWKVSLLSSCAWAGLELGVATGWVTLGVAGMPQEGLTGIVRESVMLMDWRRREDGKWVMVTQKT